MNLKSMMKALVLMGVTLAFATSVHAQATRTWVSGTGDDANPCSRTAPCKTFAGAISKTAAGGEVDTIDPGGYGTVTITKSITIDGRGTNASILFSGTNGINVSAGASDIVTLRNLSLDGAGSTPGATGIRFVTGGELNVQNCDIFGFSTTGIDVSLTSSGKVAVKDTTITPGIPGAKGVNVSTTAGNLLFSADNLTVNNAAVGLDLNHGYCQLINSHFTKCSTVALLSEIGLMSFVNSSLTNNGTAIRALTGGTVRISNDNLLDNGANYSIVGTGVIASAGNNTVAGGGAGTPNATVTVQ